MMQGAVGIMAPFAVNYMVASLNPTTERADEHPAWGGRVDRHGAHVDEGAVIGEGTKIWYFSHVMSGARIGSHCNLGRGPSCPPSAGRVTFRKLHLEVLHYQRPDRKRPAS